MGPEAPKNQNPETNQPSPEQIHSVFNETQSVIYKLSADPSFQAKCLEKGIDPIDGMNTPDYWLTFADHAYDFVTKARERQGNSLRLSAFELMTATPAFAHVQKRLRDIEAEERAGKQLSKAEHLEKRNLKPVVSYFNGIVRNFALENPTASPDKLSAALLNTASRALDPKLMNGAEADINSTIRGAKHELALGQILSHTGRSYEAASVSDDLSGVDYQVHLGGGRTLGIDAKASLFAHRKNGNVDRAYTWGNNGQLIMYSLARDSEFHGRFFIDDKLAAQRAPALNHLIDQATGVETKAN